MNEIKIQNKWIGEHYPPLIVAELSGNHKGSLERALALINAAKLAGADAVKLQTYTADTLTIDSRDEAFKISNKESLWAGKFLHELYQEAHTPWEWHKTLFDYCHKNGLIAFSSPFDETAVEFLQKCQVPCFKIASPEIVDHSLIREAAKTKKPLIISTGGATLKEIEEAVDVAKSAGCQNLILLKCTASYPARHVDINLRTIAELKKHFNVPVGLSDHSAGIGAAVCSVAFGSCLIEKHLTLSRSDGAVDSAFSLEPQEFMNLVRETRCAFDSLGQVHYGPTQAEESVIANRPSLYFTEDLSQGVILEEKHMITVRPNLGLPPKEKEKLVGLKLGVSVKQGEPVKDGIFNHAY